jgi:flagellin-like protein
VKKGISPIVAVVLLIAIAVIAAVGLYFWVTTFTSQPATPATPHVITASCIGAGSNKNGTLFISNSGTTTIPIGNLNAKVGTTTKSSLNAAQLPSGQTLAVAAGDIGATVNLTTGASGVAWATGGSSISFSCKEG